MENIYFKTDMDPILKELFKEDLVSLEEILEALDGAIFEKKSLEEDIENLRDDIRENYVAKWD